VNYIDNIEYEKYLEKYENVYLPFFSRLLELYEVAGYAKED
jgi:hypothetical protein